VLILYTGLYSGLIVRKVKLLQEITWFANFDNFSKVAYNENKIKLYVGFWNAKRDEFSPVSWATSSVPLVSGSSHPT
jgi:hypothetical protein